MIRSNNYNYLSYDVFYIVCSTTTTAIIIIFIIWTYLISCSPQFAQYLFLSRRLFACSSCVQFLMGMFILTTSPHIEQKCTGTFVRLWLKLEQRFSCLLIVSSSSDVFLLITSCLRINSAEQSMCLITGIELSATLFSFPTWKNFDLPMPPVILWIPLSQIFKNLLERSR